METLRRRAEDLHHRVRDRRLAATGLAGEADDLALVNREVDLVHRPRPLRPDAVLDRELPQLEQCRPAGARHGPLLHHARHEEASARETRRPPKSVPSSRRRRVRSVRRRGLLNSSLPASNSTRPRTVNASAAPGKKMGHHSSWGRVEFVCAKYSVTAQLVFDWSPRPRNSRPASVRSAMYMTSTNAA